MHIRRAALGRRTAGLVLMGQDAARVADRLVRCSDRDSQGAERRLGLGLARHSFCLTSDRRTLPCGAYWRKRSTAAVRRTWCRLDYCTLRWPVPAASLARAIWRTHPRLAARALGKTRSERALWRLTAQSGTIATSLARLQGRGHVLRAVGGRAADRVGVDRRLRAG